MFFYCKPMLLARRQFLLALALMCCWCSSAISAEANVSDSSPGTFTGAMDTIYPDWFKVSFLELEEDVAEAAVEGKRLMLVFHQDGCPYCNLFVERNLAQKDIVDRLKSKFDVIEFNMWGDREVVAVGGKTFTEKDFAAALSVQFTPTVLFLTEQGQLALRLNGYYDPDRFRVALDYVEQKRESIESFKEFMAANKPVATSRKLIQPGYVSGNITDLASRSGKGQKPLAVLFEQGQCKNCETLHSTLQSDPQALKLLNEFDVYQVDIWGDEPFNTPDGESTNGRKWSSDLDVSFAPTMILYSATGEEVIRSEAWFKRFHTQSILDYVVSDAWREEPSFQRYITARVEAIREEAKDVNIWD